MDEIGVPATSASTGRVEVVARAARILKAFDMEHQVLSVRGMADRTGISRSACHSIATTLVDEGLLEARPGGGYQLGQALAPIGGMVLERTGLVERATPKMEAISWRVGGEVHLAYGAGSSLIYLVRVRRDRRVRMPNRYGQPIPLHVTGAGWAVLSATDETVRHGILAALPPARRREIERELARMHERGFVVHDNFELGVRSVAAPVRIGQGAIAAITVAQPRPLVDDRRVLEIGALVTQACRALEAQFRMTSLD